MSISNFSLIIFIPTILYLTFMKEKLGENKMFVYRYVKSILLFPLNVAL